MRRATLLDLKYNRDSIIFILQDLFLFILAGFEMLATTPHEGW